MPTTEQKLPNNPLNGEELKRIVIASADQLAANQHEELMFALRGRMDRDPVFSKQYAHPRVRVELTIKFHFSNRHVPETEIEIKGGEAPHTEEDASHYVGSVHREIDVANPNLERLAAGIPFTQSVVDKPKPGEIIGTLREVVIPVAAEDYPKPESVTDTDLSEQEIKKLEVPEAKVIRRKRGKSK